MDSEIREFLCHILECGVIGSDAVVADKHEGF
jgi:hypothetical protein